MPSTPHISADAGMIAPVVLMPGDPKRSEYIAKNFLQDAVLFNDIRGVQGYTGKYQNALVHNDCSRKSGEAY